MPEDPTAPQAGYPTLFDLLRRDLEAPLFSGLTWRPGTTNDPNPLLVIVTGDLTETAAPAQFGSANSFLMKFEGATLLGSRTTRGSLFIVPGNHDVAYTEGDPDNRMAPYANFYSKFYAGVRAPVSPHDHRLLTRVHVSRDGGYIVMEINSAAYVRKDTTDSDRGVVDFEAIAELDAALRAIPRSERESMIRIGVMHHHPVLVPDLVDPDKDYDAIVNSKYLLKLLRQYGFHLILHGHKHYPHVFSYDPDSAWQEDMAPSTLVVAGGSAGSRELPRGKRRHNTYNMISVKWHPEAAQARVRLLTRGLVAEDGGGEMAPHHWQWTTLRDTDKILYSPVDRPGVIEPARVRNFDRHQDGEHEGKRRDVYSASRLNMAVSEVIPSLIPGQAYEVRLWIVPHVDKCGKPKQGWVAPVRVVWSAGEHFPVRECHREEDARFACALNYWAPMLVQAELHFANGPPAYVYTYARIPGLAVGSHAAAHRHE
jgi:3',5'-cyclic AMP phosphodiesterase CpdA